MTGAARVTDPPRARRREQRAWYFYDWANSAYVTTTLTVLFAPYLITVAEQAACPGLASGASCAENVQVLGIPMSPGSLPGYVTKSPILRKSCARWWRPTGRQGRESRSRPRCASMELLGGEYS